MERQKMTAGAPSKFFRVLEFILSLSGILITAYFAWANNKFAEETLKLNKHTVEITDKEKLQEQASKVAVWNEGINDRGDLTVTISNKSDMPIYNAIILPVDSKMEDGFNIIERIIKGTIASNNLDSGFKIIRDVPPGKHNYIFHNQDNDMGGGSPMTAILFTDILEHGWFRTFDGKLIPKDNYLVKLEKDGLTKPYMYDDY